MRFPGLDLLRALAIVWVLFFHGMVEGIGAPLPQVAKTGWMAVDLFFVLSGFLIATQLYNSYRLESPAPIRRFYIRRFFRILPTYFFMVTLYALVRPWRESSGMQPAWQFFTFTENLLIDYHQNQAFSHAWSLCVEEHFYLLFPWLVFAGLRTASWKTTTAAFVGVLLGGIALRAWIWHHSLAAGTELQLRPWRFVETLYYPSYVRCDGLLVGVALATIRSYRRSWWDAAEARPFLTLSLGMVLCAVAGYTAFPRTTQTAILFGYPLLALGFGMLLLGCASHRSPLGRLEIPGVRILATTTFSVYLSHKMTWHLLRIYTPALVPAGTAQSFLVYGATALLAGGLLYLCVERPFLRLRERLDGTVVSRSVQREPRMKQILPA